MKFLINGSLFLASILLTLLVLELCFRLFLSDKVVLFPRYHSLVKYGEYTTRRLRPNTVFWHTSTDGRWKFTTNSQGYRDGEFSYRKDSAKLRIITLGDSFTEGFEVRQDRTFSEIAERSLNNDGVKSEVFNMGISGFGTDEELILLESEALKYRPDVVVLAFYRNDYEDNVKTGLFKAEKNKLVAAKKYHAPGVAILDFVNRFYLIRTASEKSYLYSYVFNTIWDIGRVRAVVQAGQSLDKKEIRSFAVPTKTVQNRYSIRLTNLLLERFFSTCRKNNIKVIFIDIPQRYGDSSLERSTRILAKTRADYVVESQKLLKPYRNLTDISLTHGQGHMSEFSHLIIGVELANYIKTSVGKKNLRRPVP